MRWPGSGMAVGRLVPDGPADTCRPRFPQPVEPRGRESTFRGTPTRKTDRPRCGTLKRHTGRVRVTPRRGTVVARQEWIGIVGVVFAAAAVVVAVLAYFGERAERRNEQRFERIEAAIEAVARDVKDLAVDVAFLAGRQAERDAASTED